MLRLMLLLVVSTMAICAAQAKTCAETPVPIPNGGFERGLDKWQVPDGEGMTAVSEEQAASGKHSLKVVDNDLYRGSDATGPRVPVSGLGAYELRGKALPVSGSGLGLYVHVLDREGKLIGSGDEHRRAAPSSPAGQWVPWKLLVYTPKDAAFLQLWVHSYSAARATAYLDDLSFVSLSESALHPPWPGTYKIHADEKEKLTAADVVGPDGIVYPDWRYAGVPGGIPSVPVVARIEDFGGRADDERDDSAGLEAGAEEVGRRGGGALLLGAGTYYLDRPVVITRDGVVIRGAGADKTRLIFRYLAPPGGVGFLRPLPDSTITRSTWVEAHADPRNLAKLSIEAEGHKLAEAGPRDDAGPTFSVETRGRWVIEEVPDGQHTLTAVAQYQDGRRIESAISVHTDASAPAEDPRVPYYTGAIMFLGVSDYGPGRQLARDGKRGDRELLLESAEGLAAGDRVRLRAPESPRWNALVRNSCPWGSYREYQFLVEAVEGNRIRLNQPLRLDYPVVDGPYVQEIRPIRRCGIEDLHLEQTQDLWISGIIFSHAWECWARGVTVKKAGRFPLYFSPAKWCEIRDCVLDDAWFKGGGGTAYAGWESTCDCLMENVITHNLRHAPLVQWAASGNVIRKSVFHNSDGQWHAGWTNENLFEQCVIESVEGNGGYGYGMWASPPEDEEHGPNGPRNVVYNCDVRSPRAGLWMGGMNEGWLILYNRYLVGSGPGVYAKEASFDHIIRGNVFSLADPKQPAVILQTPDCTGVELIDNQVYGGNGKLCDGSARPAVDRGNRLAPAGAAPRPQPAVPSIFEWQRGRK